METSILYIFTAVFTVILIVFTIYSIYQISTPVENPNFATTAAPLILVYLLPIIALIVYIIYNHENPVMPRKIKNSAN